MSYDGWLVIDTGAGEMVDVVELGNHTSNVAPLWGHALEMAGEDIRLSDTEGWQAGQAHPLLAKAVRHMVDNPDVYKAMNLRNVAVQCERHPNTLLHWWV